MYDRVIIILLEQEKINQKREAKVMKMTLTSAPMTPREVSLKYSNGRVFEVVLRNGYKNKGM